jgi:hypothetical protein
MPFQPLEHRQHLTQQLLRLGNDSRTRWRHQIQVSSKLNAGLPGDSDELAVVKPGETSISLSNVKLGMQGSIREHMNSNLTVAMGEGACTEWNVVSDIPASQAVFAAPWLEATLSPVDTCARIVVDGERYRRLLAGTDPLLRALLENYRLWAVTHGDHCHPEAQSSVLFDCEAVHLAHTTRWLRMRLMGVQVDDQGYTREDAAARPFNVALAWEDYSAFADDLTRRLLGT